MYSPEVVAQVVDEIAAELARAHARDPLSDGLAAATLPAQVRAAPELVDRALVQLVAAERVERRGALVALAGWQPRLSAADEAFRDSLLSELERSGAEPPAIEELGQRHGRDPVPVLRLLEREGKVIAVEPGRFYAAKAVDGLLDRLRGGMTPGREYSPSELREVLGVSRKYLIPFLEYCDRTRHTERRATGRVWRASAA
ncbi:MAG: SelB C-terminal domain-containing protein [Gemmatimonadaceae bacterium]|nr:SelB C-terminal domain-containing protein [Gemmatimonadaceae bacterium]